MQVTGTYYINGTALLVIDAADSAAYCYVTTAGSGGFQDGLYGGSSNAGQWEQASVADSWVVSAGDVVQLVCYSNAGDANTYVNNASVTATLINSSFGSKPKHLRHKSSSQKGPK